MTRTANQRFIEHLLRRAQRPPCSMGKNRMPCTAPTVHPRAIPATAEAKQKASLAYRTTRVSAEVDNLAETATPGGIARSGVGALTAPRCHFVAPSRPARH